MRWLETQGKHDKVINTLKTIAQTNNKPMPEFPLNITQEKVIDISNSYNIIFYLLLHL